MSDLKILSQDGATIITKNHNKINLKDKTMKNVIYFALFCLSCPRGGLDEIICV